MMCLTDKACVLISAYADFHEHMSMWGRYRSWLALVREGGSCIQ